MVESRGTATRSWRGSNVLKEPHEAEIHVEVLMAVKQGEPGIISDKIDLNPAETFNKDRVFENSGRRFPMDFRDLEIMPMQM
jgi:hypothetical protein